MLQLFSCAMKDQEGRRKPLFLAVVDDEADEGSAFKDFCRDFAREEGADAAIEALVLPQEVTAGLVTTRGLLADDGCVEDPRRLAKCLLCYMPERHGLARRLAAHA